ncbi:MAG TPA: hypothetical protein VM848_02800 [Acidimicrobiia bacterium]|nr:hypothetical protein [Acidimicrobiia bacterium]
MLQNRVRALIVILVLGLLVSGCGPDPLARIGGGSSDWIQEPTVVTVASTQAGGSALAPVIGSDWFNSDLAPVGGTSPAEIISGVYARANSSDPFVQATPGEIAIALPGVVFPALTPPEVRYITSQLVYNVNNLTLAADQVAAFGLWTVEPYTRSRSVGQQGVFTVIPDDEGLAAVASGTADTSCARYIDQNVECSVQEVGTSPAWELTDQLGTTLVWYGDSYRYELFLRSGVAPGLAIEMADSTRPLGLLAR